MKRSKSLFIKSGTIILLFISLAFMAVISVFAAATFGSVSGPEWLNPGYQLDAEVTALSEPHNNVCLEFSVNSGAANLQSCSCTTPNCNPTNGIGTWACVIPSNYNDAEISWDISAFPGGSCTGTKVQGPTGSFNTDPTAAELINFGISDSVGFSPHSGLILIASLITVAITFGVVWKYKTETNN